MSPKNLRGPGAWIFANRPDLQTLPPAAKGNEVNLHACYSVDTRPGRGQV